MGERFSTSLSPGQVVLLNGDLGAGKTTFIQGLAHGLGITSRIVSPTFIIMRNYETNDGMQLYHVDLYRLEGDVAKELENLGLKEAMDAKKDIIVVEWAQKAKGFWPSKAIEIDFEQTGENERKITINK